MTQLSDLSDDCLIEVLEWLAPEQLFKMQRLNKRMKRLTAVKMLVKIKGITLTSSFKLFSDCVHLDTIRSDQVLVLEPLVIQHLRCRFTFQSSSEVTTFLSPFFKCTGVKSIDLGHQEWTNNLFLEVFRLCPEIECIRIAPTVVEIDKWEPLFDQIGDRIVHFAKDWFEEKQLPLEDQLLALVAAKCRNIRQVDWSGSSLTSDLVTAFKMLPNHCWIKLDCHDLAEDVFEDIFDEVDVFALNLSFLGLRLDRLSSLTYYEPRHVFGENLGVDFAGVEKLDIAKGVGFTVNSVNSLVACRFPRLQHFCFNASGALTEQHCDRLFQQMATVKKLTITCDNFSAEDAVPNLPLAILQLDNLEIIDVKMSGVINETRWQPENFLQKLEIFVEMRSLKKLIVGMSDCQFEGGCGNRVVDKVKQIKLMQSRVDVVLVV